MAPSLVLFFSQLKLHDLFSKPEIVMSVCPQRGGGGGDLSVTPSTLTGHQKGPSCQEKTARPVLFSSQLKAENLFSEPKMVIPRERCGGDDLSVTPSTLTGHQEGHFNTPLFRKMAPSPELIPS